MSLTRVSLRILVVLAAVVAVATSAAAPDRKAPRIVSAVMLDANRDSRAESVRLTYSEPVRHARQARGKFPLRVSGYRIRSIGAAKGRTILVSLVGKPVSDHTARPAITYRRTTAKPVRDRAGNQALAQVFRGTKAHGNAPTAPPPPAPAPQPPPPNKDSDGDGWDDSLDCAPNDRSIHPGAVDLPDLAFVDSNCDGIDGTEKGAIFVSPSGDDANPGTKEKPKRQIQAALEAAAGKGLHVLAAAGTYRRVSAATGVGIYGGYDQATWSRKTDLVTSIVGSPEGVFADGATDVTLQLLSIRGVSASAAGASAYGIRAVNGSSLRLQRVTVTAGDGALGAAGANGPAGLNGGIGLRGGKGACDSNVKAPGGAGGVSPVGRHGGKGGDGVYESRGQDGERGLVGTLGGSGGLAGFDEEDGAPGRDGRNGTNGAPGARGAGATNSPALASTGWRGGEGLAGRDGGHGNGGGGGGAGGGQRGLFVINGTGNGGGGGGGGAGGGSGGAGGSAGGGSFGVYLHSSTIVAETSSITAGSGGAGGRGGNGGPGGTGGAGNGGFVYCTSEIGRGGNGGRGGDGGQAGGGGGGAGGPSIGIFRVGSAGAQLTLTDTTVAFGTAGPGGAPGTGGAAAAAAQTGIAQAIYA